jgi:Fe(II)/alpha-ketoglutarate-dependent arginine beta-hydroxylase
METNIGTLRLSDAERAETRLLLDELAAVYGELGDAHSAARIGDWGTALPAAIRQPLHELRYGEGLAGLIVRGGPPQADPGRTPRHWRKHDGSGTLYHDLWLLLLVAQLGDLVCWSTLQDGRLVTDVLPVAGQERAQTGHGSRAELEFHVEDAFDDDRCDAFALACLRNPDAVSTTVASTACLDLAALDVEILAQPRFRIAPDPEHTRGLPPGERIAPRERAVLTDSATDPRLRVDPAFTAPADGDRRAAAAFAGLCAQLQAGMHDVVLEAGDVLLLDNHRTVHGRRAFRPRYDGTDRWLRKASVLRDLRRTRPRRSSAESRMLLPR